jgi:hypothetical protein
MCTADVSVFGQIWIKNIGSPFLDNNTKHKCKNFEDIRRWVEERQVSEDTLVGSEPGDIIYDRIP